MEMKISYLKKCIKLWDINVRIAQLYAMDILIAKIFYTYIDDTIKIIKILYDSPSMERAPSFKYYRSKLLSLFISDWVRLNKTVRYSDKVINPCLYDINLEGEFYFYLISPKNGDRIYYRHGRKIYE